MHTLPIPPATEDKPAFAAIPRAVLDAVAKIAGAPVAGGETVYGGFSVAANFRLDLADGRSLFAKGNHPGDESHGIQNLRQEISVYENARVLKDISPGYRGFISDGDEDGWALGLWDYVPHAANPPAPAAVLSALREWQAQDAPFLPPARAQSYIDGFFSAEKKWHRIADDEKMRARLLSLFADADDAAGWLAQNLPALRALQDTAANDASAPLVPLHGDLRCDNVFAGADGRVYIVDWPNACRGPAAFDLLFYGASLESLGQGRVEDALEGTAHTNALPLAAAIAGFMAERAGRDVPRRLPRLRWMQAALLAALLRFLGTSGAVESPPAFRHAGVS